MAPCLGMDPKQPSADETLVLEYGDAAIIVREDGTLETFLPPEDDGVLIAPGSATMVASVLLYLLTDENRYMALEAEFIDLCRKNQAEEEALKVYH